MVRSYTMTALSQLLPSTAPPLSEQPVRLVLTTDPVNSDRLDGAWWPYSCDVTVELPPLLKAISKRFGRMRAVMLNPDTWAASPQWVPWGTRRARIEWYRHQDPNIAILLGQNDKRIDLLVVPVNTESDRARAMIDLASSNGNMLTASDTLMAVHKPTAIAT
jgi:hypothetical protein